MTARYGHLEGRSEQPIAGPRHVLMQDDARFPQALKQIPRPPSTLHVIGNPDALTEGIAIIGARKATPYGRGCAARFSRISAELGVCVISGGALGCDSEAHEGALLAGGPTVAFLGGGCDMPYPKRNIPLFQRIVDGGGAVVSERDWTEPPLPWMFRERNRLIAGLAKATLVVEAGLPSGTFSTADEALAAGKDVLAVPGSICSPTSAGSNRLIAQGAHPIVDDETFECAVSDLFGALRHEPTSETSSEAVDPLIAALFANPMRLDELYGAGLVDEPRNLPAVLAAYEREGVISRFPDGRFGPAKGAVNR